MASTDRTALVTGASRGVGRATALRLAAEGVDVLVHYARNEAAAQTVVKEIHASGGRAAAARADFSDASAIADLIGAAAWTRSAIALASPKSARAAVARPPEAWMCLTTVRAAASLRA